MKKLAWLLFAITFLVSLCSAQTPPPGSTWNGSVVFGVKDHSTTFVVGHDITASPRVFGLKNFTLHAEGLVGYEYQTGNPAAGGAIVFRTNISAADTFEVGLAALYPFDSASPLKGPIKGGFIFGMSHKF